MSGDQDPRLPVDWENRLAPLRLYQSQNSEQGSLPFISPYSTDTVEHLGSFDTHHLNTDADVSVIKSFSYPRAPLTVTVALHWPSVPANVR